MNPTPVLDKTHKINLFNLIKKIMVSTIMILILLVPQSLLAQGPVYPDPDGIVFVKKGATGSGTSWTNAYPDLAYPLYLAQTNTNIKEIWVANGTYYTDYKAADIDNISAPTTDRDKAFVLVPNVKIYGGFAGTESSIIQRLPANSGMIGGTCVLSGDIGTMGDSNDNCYHVVISAGDVGNACLDGFTITGGKADASNSISVNGKDFSRFYGGGMINNASSPTLKNITIKENSAQNGAGMYNHANCYPKLTNITIIGNVAVSSGGGIFNYNSSSPALTNVIISGNSAASGGGINNSSSSPVLTNVSIGGNTATDSGGGMCNYTSSSPIIRNSIIHGNTAAFLGNNVYNDNSYPQYSYSLVQSNTGSGSAWDTSLGSSVISNLPCDADPKFESPQSSAPTTTGNYRLKDGSPCINTGNRVFYEAGKDPDLSAINTDLDFNPRFSSSQIDMGAYEYQSIKCGINGIFFVKENGTGDGSSWANAYPNLADPLLLSVKQYSGYFTSTTGVASTDTIREIWVAKGTYYPMHSANMYYTVTKTFQMNTPNDRNNAFVLVKDVKLYGGFPEYANDNDNAQNPGLTKEKALATRNLNNFPTILSGDIGSKGDNSDNCYHVVISANDVGKAYMDGFIISGGSANDNGFIITNNNFINQNSGGGIFIYTSSPKLTNVIIRGNETTYLGNGGGAFISASSCLLTNVAISGNTAWNGGGIYFLQSSSELTNVTISGNSSYQGGGIQNHSGSSTKINNSIIWGNKSETGNDNVRNYGVSINYNHCLVGGETLGSGIILNDDPKFVNWINPSAAGVTVPNTLGDYRLTISSGAIDKGDDDLYLAARGGILSFTGETDLAGNPRLHGSKIDLGAYEYQVIEPPAIVITPDAYGIVFVNKTLTTGDGSGKDWANAAKELAEALYQAKTNTTIKEIWVAESTYFPLYNAADGVKSDGDRDNAFVMVKNVQIYGGFPKNANDTNNARNAILNRNDALATRNWSAYPTILSGDIGTVDVNTDNCYHVLISSGDAGNACLDGVIITGGNANGSMNISVNGQNINSKNGGGMYNFYSSPKLNNVIISGNSADSGGGIFNTILSSSVLTNVRISGNIASNGGGIYNSDNSSPELINVTISGNKANIGGGIYNNNYSSPKIRNSIIYGNGENNIFNNNSSTPVFNYSIVDNEPTVSDLDGKNPLFNNPRPTSEAPTTAGDYSLKIGSPAINAGDNTLYFDARGGISSFAGEIDLAGNPRLFGSKIDLGAYEYQSPSTPTPTFCGGDGTLTNPYLICTAAQLDSVRYFLDKHFKLTKDINIADGTLILDSKGWLPIGNNVTNSVVSRFSGSLNGDGKIITNLWINRPNENYIGLFGYIDGARIDSLGVKINTTGIIGLSTVGGLAGISLNNATIKNCYVTGNIIGTGNNIGGLVGVNDMANITNCYTSGSINGAGNVGGLAGANQDNGKISNSYATGNISGTGTVGGLVGENTNGCSIQYCYASGSISGTYSIGGLVGNNGGSIQNCVAANDMIKTSVGDCNRIRGNSSYSESLINNYANSAMIVEKASTSGTVTGSLNNENGADKTLIVLKTFSFYNTSSNWNTKGWDIDINANLSKIWKICDGNTFPYFQWQNDIVCGVLKPDVRGIIYVKENGTGDGSSWAKAYMNVADPLLLAAKQYSGAITVAPADTIREVWVAKGKYYPMHSANGYNMATKYFLENTLNDRDNAFVLVKDVKLYGGFPANANDTDNAPSSTLSIEKALATRNWYVNETILSGDIGTANTNIDNCYHIVISVGNVGNACLDGFNITGGNANESTSTNVNGQTIYRQYGGGMISFSSTPKLNHVVIYGNKADYGGGMFNHTNSSPTLTNVKISGNMSVYGGGMYNYDNSTPLLVNVTIGGNKATNSSGGGGIFNSNASPKIHNSIIYGNGSSNISATNSIPEYKNSIVENVSTGFTLDGKDPLFITPISPDLAPTTDGDYRVKATSPAIDEGDSLLYLTARGGISNLTGEVDLVCSPRLFKTKIDLGAYETVYYVVTLSANPNEGGTATGGGKFLPGSTAAIVATPTTGYNFQNWMAGGVAVSSSANYSFSVTRDSTLVANFAKNTFTITVQANPAAGGSVTGGGSFLYGTSTTISATPAVGYDFVNWTKNGTIVTTNTNLTFPVTENSTYVANFAPKSLTIIVQADPTIGGSVTGGGTFTYGSTATVTATAYAGYEFEYWTKNGTEVSRSSSYSFQVTEGATLVAKFKLTTLTISVSPNPTAGGSATGGGTFTYGSTATITATANTGYDFDYWTKNGVEVSRSPNYSFTVTESATYVAHFKLKTYLISVSADPMIGGTVSGGGTYSHFYNATITASPGEGYEFVSWTRESDGQIVSENASYSFTVTEAASFVAHFRLKTYQIFFEVAGGLGTLTATYKGASIESGTYVEYGSNIEFNASPDDRYYVWEWTLNGTTVSDNTTTTYTIPEIKASATVKVRFISSITDILSVDVDDVSTTRDDDDFYIIAPCGRNTADIFVKPVDPDATVKINGETQNPHAALRVNLPEYGYNTFTITICAPYGNEKEYQLTINKMIPFEQVVWMRWNNTLSVINNPENNGGFEFESYRWFRNGQEFCKTQWWSAGVNGEKINTEDVYQVEMITTEGMVLLSCESNVSLRSMSFNAYPNPVSTGQTIYIEADVDDEMLENAMIEVSDLSGVRLELLKVQGRITPVVIRHFTGVYIYVFKGKDGFTKEFRVVVK